MAGVAVAALQAPAAKSVWDGVYTNDQAERGNAAFMKNCASCHDLGSEFSGTAFTGKFNGQTAFDLFDTIRTKMPMDNPGGLTKENYIDIVSFMFKSNSYPAGDAELEAKDETLKQIKIEPKP